MKKLFLQKVEMSITKKPLIIFIDKKDPALEKELEEICKRKKFAFVNIKDRKSCADLKDQLIEMTRGIILLDNRFSRGLDVKMGSDSIVLNFGNSDTLDLATCV